MSAIERDGLIEFLNVVGRDREEFGVGVGNTVHVGKREVGGGLASVDACMLEESEGFRVSLDRDIATREVCASAERFSTMGRISKQDEDSPSSLRQRDSCINCGSEVWVVVNHTKGPHLIQALQDGVQKLDHSGIETAVDGLRFVNRC